MYVDKEDKVLELIKKYKDKDNKIQIPMEQLAEELQYSVSTVWRILKSLEDKGVIKIYKAKSIEPRVIYYRDADAIELIQKINTHLDEIKSLLSLLADHLKDK